MHARLLFFVQQLLSFLSSAAAAVQLFSSLYLFVLSHKTLPPENVSSTKIRKPGEIPAIHQTAHILSLYV
jgi:hypothetical protein